MKQAVKTVFARTCIWFTLLGTGLMLLRILIDGADGAISIPRFLLLLPCGLFLALAGFVYRNSRLSGWSRLLLHYLFTILAFFLFLWLPMGSHGSVQNLLAIFLCTLLYALGFGIVRLTRHRYRNMREED